VKNRPRGMRLWHQRDSRDARNAVIAPGMIAFRLGGFAWTPAHENHQPNFLQRRESFVDRFQRGLDETPYDPRSSPPRHRSDIHQHHSAPSRRPFAAGPLRLPCPHLSGAGLPRSTDRHFGDGHMFMVAIESSGLPALPFSWSGSATARPGMRAATRSGHAGTRSDHAALQFKGNSDIYPDIAMEAWR